MMDLRTSAPIMVPRTTAVTIADLVAAVEEAISPKAKIQRKLPLTTRPRRVATRQMVRKHKIVAIKVAAAVEARETRIMRIR